MSTERVGDFVVFGGDAQLLTGGYLATEAEGVVASADERTRIECHVLDIDQAVGPCPQRGVVVHSCRHIREMRGRYRRLHCRFEIQHIDGISNRILIGIFAPRWNPCLRS